MRISFFSFFVSHSWLWTMDQYHQRYKNSLTFYKSSHILRKDKRQSQKIYSTWKFQQIYPEFLSFQHMHIGWYSSWEFFFQNTLRITKIRIFRKYPKTCVDSTLRRLFLNLSNWIFWSWKWIILAKILLKKTIKFQEYAFYKINLVGEIGPCLHLFFVNRWKIYEYRYRFQIQWKIENIKKYSVITFDKEGNINLEL